MASLQRVANGECWWLADVEAEISSSGQRHHVGLNGIVFPLLFCAFCVEENSPEPVSVAFLTGPMLPGRRHARLGKGDVGVA